MKKSLVLALAVLATAAFAATPAKKDKKQKKGAQVEQPAPVKLVSQNDSLSYAAGKYTSRGLMAYVGKEFGVDSTNVQEFVAALREGIAKRGDKQFNARLAGLEIAHMLENRIYPNISRDINENSFTTDSVLFDRAFVDAILNDTTVMTEDASVKYFESTMKAAKQRAELAYKAENEEWIKQNASKQDVKTTASGLQYKVLKEGNGIVASKDDQVTVRYEGHTIDGKEFDSSYKRTPNTTTFRPDQVIKGWTEALCMMPEGSKWELYIPENLGYGARKAGQIKPYSTLIFTVEVVKVEKKKEEAADKKVDAKGFLTNKKISSTKSAKAVQPKKKGSKK